MVFMGNDAYNDMLMRKFVRFVEDDRRSGMVGFVEACRMIGVPEHDMDSCLRENLGLSGEIVLRALALHVPVDLLDGARTV